MNRIEKIIGKVNGSMTIEGMPLTETDRRNIRKCLLRETTFDNMVQEIVSQYNFKREALAKAGYGYDR